MDLILKNELLYILVLKYNARVATGALQDDIGSLVWFYHCIDNVCTLEAG
jgi:hypothetical protein